jgi:GNAT superfamily N-acetyltransferase
VSLQLIEVTDTAGTVNEPAWLAAAEPVHRQLRPQLPADYIATMLNIFSQGGRMVVAADAGVPAGVAVFRIYDNTFVGRHLYVDDLVTSEAARSHGVGHALMVWLEEHARVHGARELKLDSGVQRNRAHRFYFREGMQISSYHFSKIVK